MPYIKLKQRQELDEVVDEICSLLSKNNDAGEYNYVITKLMHNYIQHNGLKYKHLNNVVGILECVKAEFIRTVVSPYEDQKILLNGCISSLDKKEKQ